MDDTPERALRRLSIRDDAFIRQVLVSAEDVSSAEPLDDARAAGGTDAEVVGCLVGLMPIVGVARVVSAAPKLALALGYDVAAALEDSDLPTL